MHFSLWFLDFTANVHSTVLELYRGFFSFNLSIATETKFYRSSFKANLVFSFLLHNTNIHHLAPQVTALYLEVSKRVGYCNAVYSYLHLSG